MSERFGGKDVVFAGDPAQAEMICDLLDAEGIDADVRDAGVGGMIPYMAAAGGAGAVKVVVAPEDAERAREILENAAQFRDEHTDPGERIGRIKTLSRRPLHLAPRLGRSVCPANTRERGVYPVEPPPSV